MRKQIFTWMAAAVMTAAMSTTAFAGSWQQDARGWWWMNDDGSYAHTGWEWLDGNGDGVAECYYFGADGYLLTNTTTPDGYTVNAEGAWVAGGAVQTQAAAVQAGNAGAAGTQATGGQANVYTDDYSGVYAAPWYTEDGTVLQNLITVTYDAATNTILVENPLAGMVNTFSYAGLDFRGNEVFELVNDEVKEAYFFAAPGVMFWDEGVTITRF